MDPFLAILLEIVSAKKTYHQPELRETELRAVTALRRDDLVQHARGVWRVLEPHILPQHDRLALGQRRRELVVPEKELRRPDVSGIEQQRH